MSPISTLPIPLKHIYSDIDPVILTLPQILTTEQISRRSLIRFSIRDLDVCNIAFELAWVDLFLKSE